MILNLKKAVLDDNTIKTNFNVMIENAHLKDEHSFYLDKIGYPVIINAHDHLVGNWFPRAFTDKSPYINSHIWVEDMKNAESYTERNKFWKNDGLFQLMNPGAYELSLLGVFKNIFSGVGIVQDHVPNQIDEYYNSFPIKVIKNYRQVHSLTLGNWWGGYSAEKEMEMTEGKIPFIVHLGEGLDEKTKKEFNELKNRNLLKKNTLIVHGICLSKQEIDEIAKAEASICWCPVSNELLIGEHLDVEHCLKSGVNIVLGSDTSFSGAINFASQLHFIREEFPQIDPKIIFKMFTKNALNALYLDKEELHLNKNLLVTDFYNDPYENLCHLDPKKISLLVYDNQPVFGDVEFLKKKYDEYFYFKISNREKFVIGHPEELMKKINQRLGYQKSFPFIPFVC